MITSSEIPAGHVVVGDTAPDDTEDDGSTVDDWRKVAAREGAGNLFGTIPGLSPMVAEMRPCAEGDRLGYVASTASDTLLHQLTQRPERAGQIDHTGRHPHYQLGYLLVCQPTGFTG